MRTLDLETLTLEHGSHHDPEEGMCVMEAVAWMAGEDFTDHPACVSPVIAAFLRNWNDSLQGDDRQQLKRYIPDVAGTRSDDALETRLAWMCTDWLVRVQAPAWLRLAGLTEQADLLASMMEVTPETCPSIQPTLVAVRRDADAAWAAARDAAGDAARAAAGDAAGDAARAAAWAAAGDAAGDAARAAAGDAAGDAAWDAAWAAAWAAARDAGVAAARDALRPTTVELQDAAHVLVGRMIDTAKGWSDG